MGFLGSLEDRQSGDKSEELESRQCRRNQPTFNVYLTDQPSAGPKTPAKVTTKDSDSDNILCL